MPMDIMAAISLATRSVELVKTLRDIDKQLGEAELNAKAAELLSNLADVKIALVEAGDALRQRDGEIDRLKAAFRWRGECVQHGDFLYEKKPDGTPIGTPFCPRCQRADGFMIKLVPTDHGVWGEADCPQCDKNSMVLSHSEVSAAIALLGATTRRSQRRPAPSVPLSTAGQPHALARCSARTSGPTRAASRAIAASSSRVPKRCWGSR
jgi:hypothetical protein